MNKKTLSERDICTKFITPAFEGVVTLETLDVLKVQPLNKYGSAVEIVKLFGGKPQYQQAVRELESEIYRVAQFA